MRGKLSEGSDGVSIKWKRSREDGNQEEQQRVRRQDDVSKEDERVQMHDIFQVMICV